MIEYAKDTSMVELDPRGLTLDPLLQARDPALIAKHKSREAQNTKQADQIVNILDDLLRGAPIRIPIKVFEVKGKLLVVDGFHRTKACLQYLKAKPDENLKVTALLVKNRTYEEAFLTAQQMNKDHGVGVTKEEIIQAGFRSLVVQSNFDLSVSQIMKAVSCSKGQANHIQNALKACNEAQKASDVNNGSDIQDRIEAIGDELRLRYDLTDSAWDSKGFPKIRKLSDAYKGNSNVPVNDEKGWTEYQTKSAVGEFNKILERYGSGIFREALRASVRNQELGVSVSRKSTWEKATGYSDEAHFEEFKDKVIVSDDNKDDF